MGRAVRPGAGFDTHGTRQASIHAAIRGVRTSAGDSYRQRLTVCLDGAGAPVAPVGVVDSAGHPAGADGAGLSWEFVGATGTLQSIPGGVQRGASPRGA